jgi:aldehyde dehydrogenase (NAD+)
MFERTAYSVCALFASARPARTAPVYSPRMTQPHAEAWASTPLSGRLAWLARWRGLIVDRREDFIARMGREVGKTRWEILTADLMPLLAAVRWTERRAPRLLAPRRIGGTPVWLLGGRQRIERAPLGRIAVIATWNYPVQLLGIELAHALAAGNRVVVKPSERAPESQRLLLQLAVDAGLPPGTLEWTEATREAGERLLASGGFDHVVFTGSTEVGRRIAQTLAPALTPSTLELSGRDSALVLDDADPALAAPRIFEALALNAGQTCMGPRRVLVHRRVYDAFVRTIAPLAGGAAPRDLIDEAAARHVHALAADALARGGRSVSGVLESPVGRRIRPAVIVDCPPEAPLVEGRHFGPATAVVPVASLDEALTIHRACDQHLATSVYSRDTRRAQGLAPALGAAVVTVNDTIVPTGHPGVGIAGRGPSGWGVTRGEEGLLGMTRPVYVCTSPSLPRPSLLHPTPTMARWLERMLVWLYAGAAGPRPTPRAGGAEDHPPAGATAGGR